MQRIGFVIASFVVCQCGGPAVQEEGGGDASVSTGGADAAKASDPDKDAAAGSETGTTGALDGATSAKDAARGSDGPPAAFFGEPRCQQANVMFCEDFETGSLDTT